MSSYLIYTDSAADLPVSAYEKYDIRVIPMDYMLNGESITFYTNSPDHDSICETLVNAQKDDADVHTSQITPYRYLEEWNKALKEGNDILYLSFSSGMSATYTNALSAAEDLLEEYPERKIEVVDSKAGTAGQGVLSVTAAMNREKGMAIDENAQWLREHIPYLCHRFTVGDLHYLHKGGRVSAASAIIGGMLNIKPILIIDDEGKLQVVAKARGTNSALKMLVKSYKNQMGVPDVPNMVFISHSALYDKAEELANSIREVAGPDAIVETMCETPILGVHTGPEFFSVCGWGFHRKEQ